MLDGLVDALELVGLNGLDFMLQDEQVNVLEINARPPATLDLYDADFASGLFASHLQACRGTLPFESVESNIVRASAVVYADAPLVISPKLSWPLYAADIPRVGTCIGRGAPVCTVQAEGRDFARVKSEVLRRRNRINDRLLEIAA
jgi:predicted ATP-grasp superfamily ATP-dependent carboligase